jgi:bifunctional non-homologous end joining protein LigD
MPLGRRREPFDHPDWLFELKWDGFRTLAHVTGGGSKLVSRSGNAFRGFPDLAAELALEVNADDAILDGEIVKLDADGRPQFYDLMGRRGPFALVAFDVLVLNGKDVRALPLVERKKLLRAVVPQRSSTVLFAQHVHGNGRELFAEVCRQDLEGIVAKHHAGRYGEDEPTRWLKIKNPEYSQARDRAELFHPAARLGSR